MKIFITGPYPDSDDLRAHRAQAEDYLNKLGHIVTNHVDDPLPAVFTALADSDAVLLLEGWQDTRYGYLPAALAAEVPLEWLGTLRPDMELEPVVLSRCGLDSWQGPKGLFDWHKGAAGHEESFRRGRPRARGTSDSEGGDHDGGTT